MRQLCTLILFISFLSYSCEVETDSDSDGADTVVVVGDPAGDPPSDSHEGTGDRPDSPSHPHPDKEKDSPPTSEKKQYSQSDRAITLSYPSDWVLMETETAPGGKFALNIFPPDRGGEAAFPLGVHGDGALSYIAIWPQGVGAEFPSGDRQRFSDYSGALPDLGFPTNRRESEVLLTGDGEAWAYYIRPKNPPKGWSEYGFVFAQIGLKNFGAECFDQESGAEKPLDQCDPLGGDIFKRNGTPKPNDEAHIRSILSKLNFQNT